MQMYTCPMDPDVIKTRPGTCPKCGMTLVSLQQEHGDHMAHPHRASMEYDFQKRFFITLPLVFLTMLLSPNIQEWFHFSIQLPSVTVILFLLGSIIFFFGGVPFFKGAAREIRAHNPGMMTLVALAITVGYLFSVAATFLFPGESMYWEIATLISVFLLGHWLEMRAVRGATGALSELAKLIPASAHKIEGKRVHQATHDVATSTLQKGDTVLVKPGEKIPIDGIVIYGTSSVNEAMVTGESRPIAKKKNDRVIGGTINQDGSLTMTVAKTGEETAIAQIMQLIQQAQSSKPNVQHLADRAANVLTLIAVFAGIIAFLFWFFVEPKGAIFATTLAVSAIVVACPHALGLAIPTVTTITSTLGAKNGILIKDMKALEIARKIQYVMFDKTGTLTQGAFGVADILTYQDIPRQKVLQLAAAVESHSQHSIAAGIVDKAKKQNLTIPEVKKFISYPGKGAAGIVGKKNVLVGNRVLLEHAGIAISQSEVRDNTQVFVAINKKLAGSIILTDMIRDDSRSAIQQLHDMGIKVAMLTGDTQAVAQKVGQELAIDTIFAQVLPEDKVNKMKELQRNGAIVAMVGDGVNDAPSLTQAHVGIAIGAGTDVAVESAGIVLMKNNPLDVVRAITLSRKTNSKMVQNLIWATGYNIFAIPLAAGVLYLPFGILLRPEWAALLMSMSSIIVVANALLLRRTKL